jgi:hypothetical protein
MVGTGGRGVAAIPEKLLAPDAAKYDNFGNFLDLFEDVLVSSSISDDDVTSNTGSVYTFHLSSDGNDWIFDEKLSLPDPVSYARFGTSIALGRGVTGLQQITLGVGAGQYHDSGRAYVFAQSSTTRLWSLQANLTSRHESYLQSFGKSGSMYGDTYVVGSYGDDEGADNSGT